MFNILKYSLSKKLLFVIFSQKETFKFYSFFKFIRPSSDIFEQCETSSFIKFLNLDITPSFIFY